MEEIEDTVSVDPNGPADGRRVGLVSNGVRKLADWRGLHGLLLELRLHELLFRGGSPCLASNAISVRARFSGITGVSGVGIVVAVVIRVAALAFVGGCGIALFG